MLKSFVQKCANSFNLFLIAGLELRLEKVIYFYIFEVTSVSSNYSLAT